MYDLLQDIHRIMEQNGVDYIDLVCDNKDDYYKILGEISKINENSIKVYETSCVNSESENTLILVNDKDNDDDVA